MKGALTVQITKFFHKLPKESKNSIYLYNFKRVLNKDVKIIQNSRRRSIVFEDKENEMILKKLLPEGKGDNDICALLELHDSPYFPKMFAYKKRDYLFIEKAKGKTLLEMLKEGISLEELRKILNQLIKAKKEMMSVNRYDFDFKLEHIYWDKQKEIIKWIDLGVCVKMPMEYSEEEKNKRIEQCIIKVKLKFLFYGYDLFNEMNR